MFLLLFLFIFFRVFFTLITNINNLIVTGSLDFSFTECMKISTVELLLSRRCSQCQVTDLHLWKRSSPDLLWKNKLTLWKIRALGHKSYTSKHLNILFHEKSEASLQITNFQEKLGFVQILGIFLVFMVIHFLLLQILKTVIREGKDFL